MAHKFRISTAALVNLEVPEDKDSYGTAEQRISCLMGDNSPKNQHKLSEQKHDETVKKGHEKLENAAHQHHPDREMTPDEVVALEKQEAELDATVAPAAE